MSQKRIIFSDVDGTLVFHQKFHGICQLQEYSDGTYLVQDPITRKRIKVLDVSVPPLKVYLAESTYQLAHRLREKYQIFLTTGATEATMRLRLKNLDFAHGYILENGGRILDAEFKEDQQWAKRFAPYLDALQEIKSDLEAAGWRIIDAGRKTFFQIKNFENPHRTEAEFQHLCDSLKPPSGFIKTFNLGNLTILPEAAGKGKAVSYYLDQHPDLAPRSIGIGDDINDLQFLNICQETYVLGSAPTEVIQEAQKRGWYVSSQPHFQGIDEILTMISNGTSTQSGWETSKTAD